VRLVSEEDHVTVSRDTAAAERALAELEAILTPSAAPPVQFTEGGKDG
jgi:hypothetical protein